MSLYSQLFLRETGSPYGDITRNSTLSFKDLDQNFIFLKERDINQLRVDGSNLIYETLGGTEYSVNIGGASTGATDTFVTGFTFNTGTNILTIKQNESQSDLTTNLSSLASDVYVLSGNYNPTTGDVTYVNSTGGTFVVSGFTTGMTDTFVTGGTLTGTNLVLEKSNGVDTSTIDLSSLGDTYAIVGSYLDERVARWNSTTNTLQNGLIRDDGSTVSIGGGPSASNVFFVDNTSLTVSILGQTQDGNGNQTHSIRAINKNGSANNNIYATGILAESRPTGTPSDGIYTAGRFIQGNFSEFSTASQLELTALQIQVDTNTGSDELHGINIDKFDINDAVSGNAYAIKIAAFTGAGVVSGTKYGIYQEGTDKNYFGGQLQLNTVGAATPVTNLGIDASGNVVSGTTGGSSLWSENSGDGIYFNTAGDSVAIGDTATNGISEGGKLYIKGDSAIVYALKVDGESDAEAFTIDSTTLVTNINKATIGSNGMFDIGVASANRVNYNPTSGMKMEWQQAGVLKARILTQSNYGSFQVYDNVGVSYYKLDGLNNNYENTAQDFTFGTTTSLGARVGIRGTGTGSGTSSLITQDSGGNTTFEVKDDGTVVIPNIGSTTSVTNLGIDASGNIVSGTTGGSGGVSYSADMQIPFTNAGGSDFDYTPNFIFDDVTNPTLTITSNGTNPDVLKLEHSASTGNYYTRISNYGNIEGKHNLLSWDLLSQNNGMFLRTTTALNMYLRTNSTVDNLTLFTNGNASIGDYLYNTARLNIKGAGNDSSTSSFYIKDSDDSKIFEVKDDGTVVIPNIGSTTSVTNLGVDASGNVVSGTTGGGGGSGLNYITSGDTVANNLETTSNWDMNGVYTGATATGTQADCHVDSNYWFTCVATNTWIRLIRG